jgi:hypothetical protein
MLEYIIDIMLTLLTSWPFMMFLTVLVLQGPIWYLIMMYERSLRK